MEAHDPTTIPRHPRHITPIHRQDQSQCRLLPQQLRHRRHMCPVPLPSLAPCFLHPLPRRRRGVAVPLRPP
ncbi:unnamed protein product [Linum tenue]|uniref:Uncharacterized protein n=1 Tax=Linum tenue TaxID=586396 RepID=A0AAV0S5T1_9ROSI|nr:unnamed protein product [Linum tenue]